MNKDIKQFMNSIIAKDAAYQQVIDTLTYIEATIVEQKFYEIPFADYVPVSVGNGSFSESILRNLSFDISGAFEDGNINTGEKSRLAEVDAILSPQTIPVTNWGKTVAYTIFDVAQAQAANNWDPISAKLEARKTNWDLGVQRIAFLGSTQDTLTTGLLNNADVNINLTTITKRISDMTDTEFQTFVGQLMADYRANTNGSAAPNRFLLPESDYVGLGSAASATFPNITKLEYLENVFKKMAATLGESDFRIMPSKYGEDTISGLGVERYVLYRQDAKTMTMHIPVDYTGTAFDTLNQFSFQNVAYGQYTGLGIYRPLEVLYFDF